MGILKENEYSIWWEGGFAIDGDGAYNVYGPKGTPALDYLANAGNPGNWYGIIVDKNGEPVIQGPDDPYPGMYISPTSLQDPNKSRLDPTRYVDSASVPYLAVAKNLFKNNGVSLGDIGFAYNTKTGQYSAAVVADAGPSNKYGEGSIALAKAIGIKNISPKNGGASSGIISFIFKGSHRWPKWPKSNVEIKDELNQILEGLGGIEEVLKNL